ncbi:lasso peptide biosynthesis B2 protein [Pseudomonas sp. N040]|uniref:lasso peptide biosynthesis B2 protein n=1 Tax=Pseudomonas sp. N040 TaxID=2785325 RepID=UPI0018A2A622|nr:lasso peptide biosynthesis B2 protein [Pseudomonas sp. N040]MBF7728671.1 lasso peptide biosynthesis B2 protein [Pseudomonas sp. N040]MBW7012311.1 lasso peptide biosynthesis B2 protein [Pseudomonas sp. N040]
MPLLRTIRAVLELGLVGWGDLVRAAFELALARYRLSAKHPQELLRQARQLGRPSRTPPADAHAIAARVAFAVPRVAARVPWRADCFVQAMAAQRWLQRRGIASSLSIGTRKDPHGAFQAHAWLTCDGMSITGGDSRSYVPLVTAETPLPDDGRR